MWPLDRWQQTSIVRVGALAVELWQGAGRGPLRLVARETLPARANYLDPGAVAKTLRALVPNIERRAVTVLLESALAPVMWIDTGASLWNDGQIDALFKHRFETTYGGPRSSISTWAFRSNQRFGVRDALVFGMPPSVRSLIEDALASPALTVKHVEPALAWGIARMEAVTPTPRSGHWLIWPEQDRRMLARLRGHRVMSLNPAVSTSLTRNQSELVQQLLQREVVRLQRSGQVFDATVEQDPVTFAAWKPEPWFGVDEARGRTFVIGSDEPTAARPVGKTSAAMAS